MMLGDHPNYPLTETFIAGEYHSAGDPVPGRLTELVAPGRKRVLTRPRCDPERQQARQRARRGRNLPVELLNIAQRLARSWPGPGGVFLEPRKAQTRAPLQPLGV